MCSFLFLLSCNFIVFIVEVVVVVVQYYCVFSFVCVVVVVIFQNSYPLWCTLPDKSRYYKLESIVKWRYILEKNYKTKRDIEGKKNNSLTI